MSDTETSQLRRLRRGTWLLHLGGSHSSTTASDRKNRSAMYRPVLLRLNCNRDILSQFPAINQGIAYAAANCDNPAMRTYLSGIAQDLVRDEVIFHVAADVRHEAAKCLSGIFLRPETPLRQVCRNCGTEFQSFSALYSHQSSCRAAASSKLPNTPVAKAPATEGQMSEALTALTKLGFARQQAEAALANCGGNVEAAADFLFRTQTTPTPVAPAAAKQKQAPPWMGVRNFSAPAAAAPASSGRSALRSSGGVSLRSSGSRPTQLSIFYAAREGKREAVEWFLRHGTDINSLDEHNNTALYYAVLCGHQQIVELLFDQGALLDMHEPEGDRYMVRTTSTHT